MRRFLLICVLALTAPLAGCGVFGPEDEDQLAELRENREKWRQQAPASYSYVLQRLCFCGGDMIRPVRIAVVNGERVSARYVATDEAVPEEWLKFFPTMEGLFDTLEQAIRNADAIDVSYDRARGFPITAEIDYMERAIDDELTLRVTDVSWE